MPGQADQGAATPVWTVGRQVPGAGWCGLETPKWKDKTILPHNAFFFFFFKNPTQEQPNGNWSELTTELS